MTKPETSSTEWDVLVSTCSTEDELALVEKWGDAIARYTNHVSWMTRNIPIWRLNLEPEECERKIMEADRLKTTYHNSCVDFAERFAAACHEARKGMDLSNTRSRIKQLNETTPDTAEPDDTTYELD